jgi:tRNA(Ile)-lysidine synthase
LPEKLNVWYEHGVLSLRKDSLQKANVSLFPGTPLQIPGITPIPSFGQFITEVFDREGISLESYKKTKSKNEELFDFQSIRMPIVVRGRKEGDRISPLGTSGHKKLKDLFIDKKIPLRERDTIPIVVMDNQPIWVVGICMDNSVRVTPDTKKILKLTFYKT